MMNLEPELRAKLDDLALDFPTVARLSGFTEAKLKEYIGLPELDLTAITLVLYFTHREEMAALRGELLVEMDNLLSMK